MPVDVVNAAARGAAWRARRLPPHGWEAAEWAAEARAEGVACAVQAAGEFDPRGEAGLGTYLRRRAFEGIWGRRRREQAHGMREDGSADLRSIAGPKSGDPAEEAERAQEAEAVRAALATLTAKQRDLLVGVFWDGRSERELAEEAHVRQPTIHVRKFKALQALLAAIKGKCEC